MTAMHADLDEAIDLVLGDASDQKKEFKTRLRQLIVNALEGNVLDGDVQDIIELTVIDENFED